MPIRDSLVLELQQLASSDSTQLTELLRKSLVVASKLNLAEFKAWIRSELDGYRCSVEVPPYRFVTTQLKARNPYHGLVPFLIEDPEFMKQLCHVPVRSSIGELTDLLAGPGSHENGLNIPFSPNVAAMLMRLQGDWAQLEPVRTLGRNQVAAILDAVRTKVLDWSLELESNGILGEGMTFSDKEKLIAATSQHVNIQNFQGVLGNVSNSELVQDLTMTVKAGDFHSLSEQLKAGGVTQQQIDELEAAIAKDPKPTDSESMGPNVGEWVGKMVSNAATGSWQIGVAAAGRFLGTALSSYYGVS